MVENHTRTCQLLYNISETGGTEIITQKIGPEQRFSQILPTEDEYTLEQIPTTLKENYMKEFRSNMIAF